MSEPVPSVHRDGQRVSPGFIRLKVAAGADTTMRLNNILSHMGASLLRSAFHSMRQNAASGADGITKRRYGEDLEANLCRLLTKLHTGSYKPSPSRLVEIPKGNGKLRPIAISNVEDKIVQRAVAMLLELAYEPLFTDSALGFRPKRGCHSAVAKVYRLLKDGRRPVVVDMDIEKFFNSMNHEKLIELLQIRIADKRFIRLIWKLIKSGTYKDGTETVNEVGSPQGSVVSPILANIYLHYALDLWFQENKAGHYCNLVRYADDVVLCLKDKVEAEELVAEVRDRLLMFKLTLNEAKTKIVDFSRGNPTVFNFLGFTFYWGRDRRKRYLLKLKTDADKMRKKILEFKLWAQSARYRLKLKDIWFRAGQKLKGHYAYFAITFNNRVWAYYHICIRILFKWLNRRSQKQSFTWEKFCARLGRFPIPRPYAAHKFALNQDAFDFAI